MPVKPLPAILALVVFLGGLLFLPVFGIPAMSLVGVAVLGVMALLTYGIAISPKVVPMIGLFLAVIMIAVSGLAINLASGGYQLPSAAVGGGSSQGGQQQTQDVVTSYVCTGGETPSVLFKGVNARSGAANTETAIYQKQGETGWTAYTHGTAITAFVPGTTYVVVPSIDISTFTGKSFGMPFVYTSPCRAEKSITLYDDATTFTGTFFNANDAAAYASLTASTDATISVKMQAAAKTVFGNPYLKDTSLLSDNGNHRKAYPNMACIQANDTWFDTTDTRSWLSTGEEMHKLGQPLILSAATGDTVICFESPVVTDQAIKQYFYLDIGAAGVGDDGTVNFYPGGMFIDSDGNLQWGSETDTGAAVGAAVVQVTLDVTA